MNTFVVNLKYCNWENQICFTPVTEIAAPEDIPASFSAEVIDALKKAEAVPDGAKKIFCGLIPKIDDIAREYGNRCDGNMLNELDFLGEVTNMFNENGFVRIQR